MLTMHWIIAMVLSYITNNICFSEIMMARLPCGCSTEVIFVLHLPPSSYFRILLFNLFNVFLMLHNVECRTMMNVAQGYIAELIM